MSISVLILGSVRNSMETNTLVCRALRLWIKYKTRTPPGEKLLRWPELPESFGIDRANMSDVGYLRAAAQRKHTRDATSTHENFGNSNKNNDRVYMYMDIYIYYIIVFNRDDDSTDIHIYIVFSPPRKTNKRAALSLNIVYIDCNLYEWRKKKKLCVITYYK